MADQRTHPKKYLSSLPHWPLYLALLPVFFVFNEYTANYDAIPAADAIALYIVYVVTSFILAGLAWLYFRNFQKAALLAFLVMGYNFFYGSVRDLVADQFPESFLLRYKFIFPFSFLLFATAIIWLKKRKRPLTKLSTYLSVLLAVLTIVDVFTLLSKAKKPAISDISKTLTPCDTCSKPDIYLIVPDGYSGLEGLKAQFNFDNTPFYNELSSRGFHVAPQSSSNYNFTMYSMASLLNMDYISVKKGKKYLRASYTYNEIRDNLVTKYLSENGYGFYNFSHFDVEKQPATEYSFFTPTGIKIITSQTFLNRLVKDYHSDILKGRFGKSLQRKYAYEKINFNKDIVLHTKSVAMEKSKTPTFVYAHLFMPHYPFFYDSKGKMASLEKLEGLHKDTKHDYIEYLKYTNTKIVELVDYILAVSAKPPVIMILSDHGFIHPRIKDDPRYNFSNLNAIYLPNGNYGGFYDSISNVNQFRVLFNTCFGQQIPLAKDTSANVIPVAEATETH